MELIQKYILRKLDERKKEDNFRSLRIIEGKVDFTSNDYIGLSRDTDFQNLVRDELQQGMAGLGSTGSRLLSGNNAYTENLEREIAEFHSAPSALLFNSGFTANYGLLATLPYRGDTIIYDELVHASIHDGIKASKAGGVAFRHNDINDLEVKLTAAAGLKYVVTESLFSMDGDLAPLQDIAALCRRHGAGLIVDEAHATGVIGDDGGGLVGHLGIEDDCLARVHTFGKALGAHGAVVLGSESLREFLINYCRPFIFSTALPFHTLAVIRCAYGYFPFLDDRRTQLTYLASVLRTHFEPTPDMVLLPGDSPIQSLMISGNEKVKSMASKLQDGGFDVRAILSPTVPKGAERIRICLHSFNTGQEVRDLAALINKFGQINIDVTAK